MNDMLTGMMMKMLSRTMILLCHKLYYDLHADRDDDEDAAPPPAPGPTIPGLNDLPLGTKMRVRYGRGRNQREYEAKVRSQSYILGISVV